MLVKDMPTGAILWYKNVVVGVKGVTLLPSYEEYKCCKITGNRFDYELDTYGLPLAIYEDLEYQNYMIENEETSEDDEDYEDYDYEED